MVNRKGFALFLILLFLFDNGPIYSQKTIILTDSVQYYNLTFDKIDFYEDSTTKMSFAEIEKANFSASSKASINSGFSNSKFWYRITVQNKAANNWLLSIGGTILDEIELFDKYENGKITRRVTGDNYKFSSREVDSPTFAFYLNLKPSETRTFFISVNSKDTKQFKFYIRSEKLYFRQLPKFLYVLFFYFGILFMMVLYNLLLYFSIRNVTYLYYVLYIASFSMMQFAVFGLGNQFIWGEFPWFGNRAHTLFAGICTISISFFSYNYLNIKRISPNLKPYFIYLAVCGFVIAFLNFLNPTLFSNLFSVFISIPNVLLLFILGLKIRIKGYKPARYYIVAWGILFVAILLFLVNSLFGFSESNYFGFILPIGGLIEVTILSFALGKSITAIEKDKTEAQREVVKQLKNNEETRVRIARDLHDDLGSTLSSINILSEFAKNESKNHPENIPNILQKINESSKKLQDNLQDIVWTTQNSEHILESLTSRMRLFAGEIFEAKDIDYQIDIDKKIGEVNLSSAIQYDVFMIYKEAINNIVKYAKAQKVRIEFTIFENEIRLKIIDNGHGFDLNSEKTGNGLKNMKSRAENIGAILHLKSEIGKGSMVDLILPVPN